MRYTLVASLIIIMLASGCKKNVVVLPLADQALGVYQITQYSFNGNTAPDMDVKDKVQMLKISDSTVVALVYFMGNNYSFANIVVNQGASTLALSYTDVNISLSGNITGSDMTLSLRTMDDITFTCKKQ